MLHKIHTNLHKKSFSEFKENIKLTAYLLAFKISHLYHNIFFLAENFTVFSLFWDLQFLENDMQLAKSPNIRETDGNLCELFYDECEIPKSFIYIFSNIFFARATKTR